MKIAAFVSVAVFLAACTTHAPPADPLAKAEEARAALLEMVNRSGNRWMAEDLQDHKLVKDGGDYRIGRWRFSLDRMTFAFLHQNDNAKPPVRFEISGVLEQDASDKITARVTATRRP